MSTVTSAELAQRFGVGTSVVRDWVARGHIEPVRRGARPLKFRDDDVARFVRDRMGKAERERLDTLARQWRLTEPNESATMGARTTMPTEAV